MNMVSIQGTVARTFFLEEVKQLQFHSKLHSMFDSQYFMACSSYKTDIIYESQTNLNDYLINQLFKLAEKPFDAKSRRQFYTSEGSKNTLEAFFIRLYHFTQQKDWYENFIVKFDKQARENPSNPITRHLLGCFRHIDLQNFRNLYDNDLPKRKLTVNRHQTYMLLTEYLSQFNSN